MSSASLPVVVIGAGPVGLAAAAHLVARGQTPVVLESGPSVGASILKWAHVRVFSPWRYNTDRAAVALLERAGWSPPPPDDLPTGRDLVERYLQPLAAVPEIAPNLHLKTTVLSVTRQGYDKLKSPGRESAPFVVRVAQAGTEQEIIAKSVIDASGTYALPNPLGGNGVPAIGEAACADHIAYGIPDVLGADRARYAGRRVLVVGSGHSAFNALLDLGRLADEVPGTQLTWAVRRANTRQLFGGGSGDGLPARGALGTMTRALVDSGRLTFVSGFSTERLTPTTDGIVVSSGDRDLAPVDEIIGATGFRPDLSLLTELRVDLDATVEAPSALAPLIDPNLHSCGSVPPHGEAELRHPEAGFYIVGMKSYGRAPTFLMLTGYEQVRSVVAAISGDMEAARNVELVLPETGVCVTDQDEPACCGSEPAATPEPVASASCSAAPAASEPVVAASACCSPAVREAVAVATACCAPVAPADADGETACCSPLPDGTTVPGELPVLAGVGAVTAGSGSSGCCQ